MLYAMVNVLLVQCFTC